MAKSSNPAGPQERPDTYWDGRGQVRGDSTWTRGLAAAPFGLVGESLPPLEEGEAEIALIKQQTTTGDLYSVRARREKGEIEYRVVDEYENDIELEPLQSAQPLSLPELGELLWSIAFDGGTPFFRAVWEEDVECEYEEVGTSLHLESDFYPGVQRWYEARLEDWLEQR